MKTLHCCAYMSKKLKTGVRNFYWDKFSMGENFALQQNFCFRGDLFSREFFGRMRFKFRNRTEYIFRRSNILKINNRGGGMSTGHKRIENHISVEGAEAYSIVYVQIQRYFTILLLYWKACYSMFRGVVTTFISQLRLSFTRNAIAGIKS